MLFWHLMTVSPHEHAIKAFNAGLMEYLQQLEKEQEGYDETGPQYVGECCVRHLTET